MDDANDRALGHYYRMKDEERLFTDFCIKRCFDLEEPYAGLHTYRECFCGTTYNKHGKVDETECNTICDDPSGLMCGGRSRLSVYKTGI